MKIVCLGDSVTAGIGVPRGQNWVSLLDAQTHHDWINAGVVGDTMAGMLTRLNVAILPQKPQMVFLLGGWNDLLICGNFDSAKTCLMAMVHHCVYAGVSPVVGIPYAISSVPEKWKPVCSAQLPDFTEYIAWLRQMSKAFHLRTVDVAAAFDGQDGLLSDGIHPNVRGHRVIAEAVKKSDLFGENRRHI